GSWPVGTWGCTAASARETSTSVPRAARSSTLRVGAGRSRSSGTGSDCEEGQARRGPPRPRGTGLGHAAPAAGRGRGGPVHRPPGPREPLRLRPVRRLLALHHEADRKSTRLNSSHVKISYAVFCLKKKTRTRT